MLLVKNNKTNCETFGLNERQDNSMKISNTLVSMLLLAVLSGCVYYVPSRPVAVTPTAQTTTPTTAPVILYDYPYPYYYPSYYPVPIFWGLDFDFRGGHFNHHGHFGPGHHGRR